MARLSRRKFLIGAGAAVGAGALVEAAATTLFVGGGGVSKSIASECWLSK